VPVIIRHFVAPNRDRLAPLAHHLQALLKPLPNLLQ
jgi:hypothetical protein